MTNFYEIPNYDGKYNINYGMRNELSAKKHRKKVVHETDIEMKVYDSINEACKKEKLCRQTIRTRCNSLKYVNWYFKEGDMNV